VSGEKPREIFLAACAEIAQGLVPLGFRYLRSKPRLVRQEGDLRFEILFGSHPRNWLVQPDQRDATAAAMLEYGARHNLKFTEHHIQDLLQGSVDLTLMVAVYSRRVKQWRESQPTPLRLDDYVAGDEIGRLRTPPALATFNLAPKATRQQCIVEAAVLCHEVALPFFDVFRRPDELMERLMDRDLPGFWEATTFDYVLCFGGRELGLDLLRRRLDAEVGHRSRFHELLPRFRTKEWREMEARQRANGMQLGGHQEIAGRLATIAAAYQLHLDE
jgi:hypothetical protein